MKPFRIVGDVVLSQFPDSHAVLLDVSKRRYHTLNPTAAFLWTLLESGVPTEAVLVASLMKEFDVSEPKAVDSVRRFSTDLRAYGLIEDASFPSAS